MTADLLVERLTSGDMPDVSNSSVSGFNKFPDGITPLDLDQNPAVERFLGELGYGVFVRSALTAPFGRNDVWAGPTSSGEHVFVKRLTGSLPDVAARMDRLHAFQRVFAAQPGHSPGAAPLEAPEYLGRDVEHGLVAYRMVTGATGGASHVVAQTFDDDMARRVGGAVAAIHRMTVPADVRLDDSLPNLPSLDLVNGLPLEVYENISNGELEAWRLQQNDLELVRALSALRWSEAGARRTPAHCDLRADQLLFSGGRVLVADWEEFRLADPARDVGGFAGEWLHRSVLDIVTSRGAATDFADVALDHEAVLRKGVATLQSLRPRIEHFWAGYRAGVDWADEDFAARAAAFAGWHMLDRLIAGSAYRGLLSGIERAAAGIGRIILIDPRKFVSAIGLGVPK